MARLNVSINVTKLYKMLTLYPTLVAFKGKTTNDSYINATVWINDEIDDFNNDVSIQLNVPETHAKLEKNFYFGSGRSASAQEEIKRRKDAAESKLKFPNKAVTINENGIPECDDLPF